LLAICFPAISPPAPMRYNARCYSIVSDCLVMSGAHKRLRAVSPHGKQRKTQVSPHENRNESENSPHLVRKSKNSVGNEYEERFSPEQTYDYAAEALRDEIATKFDKYMMVFKAAPDEFWNAVRGIQSTDERIVKGKGMALLDRTISLIPKQLRAALPNPLPNKWKEVFIEAVRTRGKNGFPKNREKQAKFLAASLAAIGPRTGARRSRDICLEYGLHDTASESLKSDLSLVLIDDSDSILS
jgi:hypothetical protein